MESEYWWHKTNLAQLERGEYFIKDEELDQKIGPLSFSTGPWKGKHLFIKGAKCGQAELYQIPRNCGNIQFGNIYAPNLEYARVQHHLVVNVASACGYNMINASCRPPHAANFEKLGWVIYNTNKANRSIGVDMSFMYYRIPDEQMALRGYGFNEDIAHKANHNYKFSKSILKPEAKEAVA